MLCQARNKDTLLGREIKIDLAERARLQVPIRPTLQQGVLSH